MKTFTAQVRVGEQLYGNGVGRSKKEAEQAAAETAYGEIAAELGVERPAAGRRPTGDRPDALTRCPSSPRSRSSARGLERHVVGAHHHRASRSCTRARSAATRAGPTASPPALTGRPRSRPPGAAASTSGCPLDNGDALLGHLGMSGQLLVQPPGRARRAAPAGAARARRRRRPELRFVDQRMFGGLLGLRRRRRAARRDRPHRPRPARPGVRRRRCSCAGCAGARPGVKRLLLDQTLVSGVGNIYADEALWRARLHGERPGTG